MKHLFVLALAGSLLACSKDKNSAASGSLAGTWKRTETLRDPGDGSGQWMPVPLAERTTVTFGADGSLSTSNYPFLDQYERYRVLSDSLLRLYKATDSTTLGYGIEKGRLRLDLTCIEACRDRFVRTGN